MTAIYKVLLDCKLPVNEGFLIDRFPSFLAVIISIS